MIFEGYEAIASTENHIKQLHGVLLKYSSKDQDHRGQYKTVTNLSEPDRLVAQIEGWILGVM
jgi:hypothetical protein